ncbi:M48 family metalloprotease [Streptomonospora wellingtoniae]|uniref:M48 family metalloprotease n=1 Tax=Streptomonospora wellingtoniae TaxID=3075544 RepID=A0ABU2KNV7_9ACTN|nr:M48 family metalloprotease [Streptomonospora sp. DSM 45055]MDT0300961.1 M48 family metalloprotease [Streptomonospora sp. DSM 45055]
MTTSAAVTLLFGLPWLLSSMIVLTVAAGLVTAPFTFDSGADDAVSNIVGWAVVVGFPLSGALPLWGPVENTIARLLFRFRPPSPQERQRIDALWAGVARRAGIDPAAYTLWVQDADDVNASAGAGRTVGVTRFALAELAPAHLEAVLAHELGHHLGGHPWARILVYWYSLPTRAVLRLAGLITRLLTRLYSLTIGAMLISRSRNTGTAAFVGCALLLVPAFCVLPFLLPLVPLVVAAPVDAWFSRRGELYADRVAADLGYGPHLADLFQLWQAQGYDDGHTQAGALERMMSSHPALHARLTALQRHAQRSGA